MATDKDLGLTNEPHCIGSRINICMVCDESITLERQNAKFITCCAECERMYYIGKKLNGVMDELRQHYNHYCDG